MKISRIEPEQERSMPRRRVAAYARVSMETGRLRHSLEAQISRYEALIRSDPEWEYAGVYADDAVSGTGVGRREAFNRLIRDCGEGLVDLVLVKSVSRFARNTLDLLETVRRLKDMGVEVWFEQEGIRSMDGDGELMLSILASFAEEESRSISENCRWGIRRRFERGIPRGIRIYGYRTRNGALEIQEEEAAVVRRVFRMFLDGASCNAIAGTLEAEGVRSLTGGTFCREVISGMLRQEKYTGCTLAQKVYTRDHVTHKRIRNRGELPMYFMEGTHPAVISVETFQAAQREFARRYGVGIVNGVAQRAERFRHTQGRREEGENAHRDEDPGDGEAGGIRAG